MKDVRTVHPDGGTVLFNVARNQRALERNEGFLRDTASLAVCEALRREATKTIRTLGPAAALQRLLRNRVALIDEGSSDLPKLSGPPDNGSIGLPSELIFGSCSYETRGNISGVLGLRVETE